MSRPASMASLLMEAIRARVDSTSALHPAYGHLLRGLDGVALLEVHVSPALEAAGIQPANLRDALAQQLALARIPTPAPHDGVVLGGLQAAVKGLEAGDGTWALCVALELRQRARLSRDATTAFDATTWCRDAPAVCGSQALESTCMRLVAELTKQLAAALQEAET